MSTEEYHRSRYLFIVSLTIPLTANVNIPFPRNDFTIVILFLNSLYSLNHYVYRPPSLPRKNLSFLHSRFRDLGLTNCTPFSSSLVSLPSLYLFRLSRSLTSVAPLSPRRSHSSCDVSTTETTTLILSVGSQNCLIILNWTCQTSTLSQER